MSPRCVDVIPEVAREEEEDIVATVGQPENTKREKRKQRRKRRRPSLLKRLFSAKGMSSRSRNLSNDDDGQGESSDDSFSCGLVVQQHSLDDTERSVAPYIRDPNILQQLAPRNSLDRYYGADCSDDDNSTIGTMKRHNKRPSFERVRRAPRSKRRIVSRQASITSLSGGGDQTFSQVRRWLFPVAENDDKSTDTVSVMTLSSETASRRFQQPSSKRRQPSLDRRHSNVTNKSVVMSCPPPTDASTHSAVKDFRYTLYQNIRYELLLVTWPLAADLLAKVFVLVWFLVLPPKVVFPIYRRIYNYLMEVWEACCVYFGLPLLFCAPFSGFRHWIRADDMVLPLALPPPQENNRREKRDAEKNKDEMKNMRRGSKAMEELIEMIA